ncbi:TonB-system energizer ExbB [Nitrospira lenta]|uniref:Biopolymer transport protein ExbB n=1 Tax=Nitrospira lenta TaxID=1436998 RepID=A0A330L9V7_9BACT|nr:TonB-system energizer ExbB [Nitrospira lenta]SPP63726.1 Biopolymer transport protein ExbB [Nitrospira lenta]
MDALKEIVDYGVIGLLLALGLVALGVAIERWRYFQRINPAEFQHRDMLEMALTKHLVIIGTIAANAPYIGLLGTVLGIMLTFHTMGTSGALAVATIMVGLSLALKATAVGLLIAIPCVVMNNVLRRRVSELLTLHQAHYGS